MRAVVAVAFIALVYPAAGWSHAIVRPLASRPADLQVYTVVVPTERDVATTEVAVQIPEGIDFVVIGQTPGWTAQVSRRNDRIDVVRWRRGTVPPDFFAEFRLIARNPILEGTIAWRIVQTYANGEVVRWIGPPDSEEPASRTRISEDVAATDVVTGLTGGPAPATPTTGTEGETTPTEAEAAPASAEDDGAATLAIVLAAVGLLTGIGGITVALLTRRQLARPPE